MKKFKFSLDRLFDFKQTMLDREKLALASLRAQLAEIEAEIERITAQVAVLQAQKTEKATKGTTVFELQKLDFQIEASRGLLKDLYIKRDIKELEIQRQLNVVMAVKSEVQGLEKLHEKQLDEYNYEIAKQTAEEIGEMVSGKIAREGMGD